MILSDREILAAIERRMVRITPQPGPECWSSTAIDLTLDSKIQEWREIDEHGMKSAICPENSEFNATALAEKYASLKDCSNGYVLLPGKFVLGWTVEKIQLPHISRVAARVEGKSSLARIGVGVHVTAPTIHAGFGWVQSAPDSFHGNPIQLEIWNAGPLNIQLTKGMRICQLIFEEVHGTPNKGYEGQFKLQGPKA